MEKTNILLLGSGGREHALAWKMAQSALCGDLFIAPGNPGTAECGQNVDLSPTDFAGVRQFCLKQHIGLLVVGPEAPLVAGIVDYLRAEEGLSNLVCIGPGREGAMLEGSKAFAKEFMARHDIPTAAYRQFTAEEIDQGLQYLEEHILPIVLKADGLAGGKGVLICESTAEAKDEFRQMLSGKFGDASATVVVEQFLSGIEFSVFAVTDGQHFQLLPIAKDYKRIGEGDSGLNTGGMGSISPVPFVDAILMDKVLARIVEPTIAGLASESINYQGFVFFGLISVNGDPYVIEYNCRMGDPETQSVMPRLKSDLVDLLLATHQNRLAETTPDFEPKYATSIVCVSGGYPGSYEKGKEIALPEIPHDVIIFHAGTATCEDKLVTSGGRVLAVTARAEQMSTGLELSLHLADAIEYAGKYFRRDIGFDL